MAKSKKSKKKNSSVPVWMIVGGVAGVGVLLCCIVGMASVLPAIQQAREAARRAQAQQQTGGMPLPTGQTTMPPNLGGNEAQYQSTMQNVKRIGLAAHNFHETYLHFPPKQLAPNPLERAAQIVASRGIGFSESNPCQNATVKRNAL